MFKKATQSFCEPRMDIRTRQGEKLGKNGRFCARSNGFRKRRNGQNALWTEMACDTSRGFIHLPRVKTRDRIITQLAKMSIDPEIDRTHS